MLERESTLRMFDCWEGVVNSRHEARSPEDSSHDLDPFTELDYRLRWVVWL